MYHYTTGHKLPRIQESELLRPSRDGLLWFSTNPHYEMSALKPINGKLNLMFLLQTVGVFRFKINPERVHPAKVFFHDLQEYESLARAGCRMGANPEDWFATTLSIKLADAKLQKLTSKLTWVPTAIDLEVSIFGSKNLNVVSRYA